MENREIGGGRGRKKREGEREGREGRGRKDREGGRKVKVGGMGGPPCPLPHLEEGRM